MTEKPNVHSEDQRQHAGSLQGEADASPELRVIVRSSAVDGPFSPGKFLRIMNPARTEEERPTKGGSFTDEGFAPDTEMPAERKKPTRRHTLGDEDRSA